MVGAVHYRYLVLLAISYFQTIGTIYEISLSAAVQPMSHDLCCDIIGQQVSSLLAPLVSTVGIYTCLCVIPLCVVGWFGSVVPMITMKMKMAFHLSGDNVGDRYRLPSPDYLGGIRQLQRLVLVVVVLLVVVTLLNDHHHHHHPMMTVVVTTTVTAAAAASPPVRRTPDTSITTVQNYMQRRRHSLFDRVRKHLPRHGLIAPPSSSSTGTTTRISGRTKRTHRSVVGTKLTFRFPTKELLTKWYCCCDQQPHGPQYTTDDDPSVEMTNNLVHTTTPHHHYAATTTTTTKIPMVNHPYAGMTNPTVNYQWLYHQHNNNINNNGTSLSECRNSHTDRRDEPQQWWPPVSSLLQQPPSTSLRGHHKNRRSSSFWRVLQYRQTVGHGYDCYQTCRDAILSWEFQNNHPPHGRRRRFFSLHRSQGIIALPTPVSVSSSSSSFEDPSIQRRRRVIDPPTTTTTTTDKVTSLDTTDSAQQIRWGPGQRLITYTSTPTISLLSSSSSRNNNKWINVLNRFLQHQLPKLHVVNPVTVLYNVVDQTGGSGPASDVGVGRRSPTTYTSTAYGTGYGHWLCGEERITVCYRHATTGDHPDDENQGRVDVEIVSYSKPHSTIGRIVYPFLRPLQHSFFVSHMNYLQALANTTQPS